MGFLELFAEKIESEELPPLIQIGTCGLHTIHGSMKAGVKNSNWNIRKILKAAWKLLDEAPAWRELFEKVTETCIYPLPYCGHRWCENEDCAHRAERIWQEVKKFVAYLKDQPKSKQPQSSSFQILLQAVEDPYIPAKLKVVEYVAGKLSKYLHDFQTDQPMVPFLNGTLLELLCSLMSMFINNDTMKKALSSLKLLKIDTSCTSLYKQDAVQVGMGAKVHTWELKKQLNFKKSTLLKFYKETCGSLAAITSCMTEKSPISYQIVHFASSMDPVYIANENTIENCTLRFSKLIEKLVYLKGITSKVGDDATKQFMKMISEVVPKYKDKFLEFNKYEHRLDTFFHSFYLRSVINQDTLKRSSKKRKKKIKAKSTWKERLYQMKSLMFKRKKHTSKKVLMIL